MPQSAPCVLVIFGASGDLAKRKLLPAVYDMAREKLLPQEFALVGYSRTELSDQEYRRQCADAIREHARIKPVDDEVVNNLVNRCFYVAGAYDKPADILELYARLEAIDRSHDTQGNRLFYLSTPPNMFEPIITQLGEQQHIKRHDKEAQDPGPWHRVIIEKPFGHDLRSAQHLNHTLHQRLDESQIFRIDHYLGKETVQNLMVLRFANSIFEPIWNYKYIDHVQITVSETLGVGSRGGYYDRSGALRDMVENHIFQILALVAMEPPVALDSVSVRDEKVKIFKAVRPIRPSQVDNYVVRGQYAAANGVGNYLDEKGVAPDSRTETFVALKMFVDNWRWSGTPFYIRTGKCLPEKLSEVVVRFRSAPLTLFQKQCESPVFPNDLVIRVQPDEGISLRLNGKVPGGALNIKNVALDFLYRTTFSAEPPEAYERLIFDALLGDQTLFIRGDEVEAAWSVIDPIQEGWQQSTRPPEQYPAGSWGPKRSMELIDIDGRRWLQNGQSDDPVIACAL